MACCAKYSSIHDKLFVHIIDGLIVGVQHTFLISVGYLIRKLFTLVVIICPVRVVRTLIIFVVDHRGIIVLGYCVCNVCGMPLSEGFLCGRAVAANVVSQSSFQPSPEVHFPGVNQP